jgi:hypothetical protein
VVERGADFSEDETRTFRVARELRLLAAGRA